MPAPPMGVGALMPTIGVTPPPGVWATGVSSQRDRTFFSPTTGVAPPKAGVACTPGVAEGSGVSSHRFRREPMEGVGASQREGVAPPVASAASHALLPTSGVAPPSARAGVSPPISGVVPPSMGVAPPSFVDAADTSVAPVPGAESQRRLFFSPPPSTVPPAARFLSSFSSSIFLATCRITASLSFCSCCSAIISPYVRTPAAGVCQTKERSTQVRHPTAIGRTY